MSSRGGRLIPVVEGLEPIEEQMKRLVDVIEADHSELHTEDIKRLMAVRE